MRLFGNTTKKANDKDNAKIKMVEVSQLRFDRDFKNVFQQENDKVAEIANDMRTNGFDKSRPIIVTEAYIIVDGHSRFLAAKKAGIIEEVADDKVSNTGKGINSDSFKLGVLFVLSELERGRKKSQLLKDKRIAKLELGEVNLSEEDVARISQRFGIA